MPRNLILLTGASRGYGRAIAVELASSTLATAQYTDVVLAARNTSGLEDVRKELISKLPALHVVTHAADFADPDADAVAAKLLAAIPHPAIDYTHAILINNAGSLGTLARMRNQAAAKDIAPAVHVNLTAPMALTTAFMRHFAAQQPQSAAGQLVDPTQSTQLTLINISSLAGIQPFDCWGVYCAVKAARDMYHQTIAVEEPKIRTLNYAPGPLDTDMQDRIRKEMPDVPLREVYTSMHTEGKLVQPADSARVLIRMMEQNEFQNGAHVDYYDVAKEYSS
ncbi:hypothetical protein DFS34DRAFT_48555 [Phlyctochytrium arcticum]|nr:hypothetical protein DFS34DRAFT_48555 [Phlyctochytrium arcticum]